VQETPARAGKQPDSARQLIERAQHILAHEQRSGHQDNVVKPGGIEAFIERWATQMRDARDRGEIAAPPAGATGRFPEVAILHLLTGYRTLDPMQRAAKIRAALALLDAFDTPADAKSATRPRPASAPAASPRPGREAPRFGQPANGHAAKRPTAPTSEENWPLAKPLPKPPILPAERPRAVALQRHTATQAHPERPGSTTAKPRRQAPRRGGAGALLREVIACPLSPVILITGVCLGSSYKKNRLA